MTMANSTEVAEQSAAKDGVNPNRRRIIKAASPKVPADDVGMNGTAYAYPSPSANGVNLNKKINDDDDIEDRKKKKKGHKHDANPIVEDKEETAESWRQERQKASEKRAKALREKELQERRKKSSSQTADATANPFSRFLSVFSVETKHPEHKRSLETEPGDDDLKGPSEKRLKPSDEPDYDREGKGDAPSGLFHSRAFWITAAVAVCAGVAFALQRGRKK